MSCPHNLWDRTCFNKLSSCSLTIIILHSHQWNISRNSLEMSWKVFQLTSPSPIPLSIDVTRWAVNGANVEIPSTCAYMCQNLTWLDKTHASMAWEGFKDQGCMLCPHNRWDRPRFHQCSSCSLIVIICHSHQLNHCQNSLEMSWNFFQEAHHQCNYPPTSHIEQWKGPTLKFLQLVPICIKIDMVR